MGTIDFYPNFGYDQPWSAFGLSGLIRSHNKAHDYFCESIAHPEKFITNKALVCDPSPGEPVLEKRSIPTVAQMGYFADKHARKGLFYVDVVSE